MSHRKAPPSRPKPSDASGFVRPLIAVSAAIIAVALAVPLLAQLKPTLAINEDCQVFAISPGNDVVYSVPHIRRVQKNAVERDEVWITTLKNKVKRLIDPDKFMPIPPLVGFVVDSLAWSPDGHRIAVSMSTLTPVVTEDDEDKGETKKEKRQKEKKQGNLGPVEPPVMAKQIALLDDDGHEIAVSGSKTRFIEHGTNAAWLADGASAVYLTGGGPYQIVRVHPADGQTKTLFAGHTFDAVVWDTQRNQAFAVGNNLSITGRNALVQLNLVTESVNEVSRIGDYRGELSVSLSGKRVGFFEDGDTIVAFDLAHPHTAVRVHAGYGRFEWSKDDRHILLKRGPDDQSNDLVWVGVDDGSFVPVLHDLVFHDFSVSPDGDWIAVTQPGKRTLQMYPAQ